MINAGLFWAILILEVLDVTVAAAIRHSSAYIRMLGLLLFYLIVNQVHLASKTRGDDIEISKLLERSLLLEGRVGSTIAGYIRVNLVAVFALRWCFANGFAAFDGIQADTAIVWFRLAIENTITLLFVSTIFDYFGVEIPSIQPVDLTAGSMMTGIFLFNNFVAWAVIVEVIGMVRKLRSNQSTSG